MIGALAVLLTGAALAAFAQFRSEADRSPPSPPPSTPASPEDVALVDPRALDAKDLVPPGSTIRESLYADLDGDGDEEVILQARRPTGDLRKQDYVRVFSWHDGEWRTIFNSLLTDVGAADRPSRVLINGTKREGQNVEHLALQDIDEDGLPEVIIVVQNWRPLRDDVEVWMLIFPLREPEVRFYRRFAGRMASPSELRTPGGHVEVVLHRCAGREGNCSQSREERNVIGYAPDVDQVVVLP